MKNARGLFFFVGPLAFAAFSLPVACSHPAIDNSGNGGTGPSGSGGATGFGGSGGAATGSGGMIVLPPPGGTGGGTTTTKVSCNDTSFNGTLSYSPGYPDHAANMAAAMAMLPNLSPTDKLSQMRGVPTNQLPAAAPYDIFWQPDNTAKSIRGFTFRDGPRGVNMDAPLLSGSKNAKSTAFPQAIARGATFDLDLEHSVGQAMGDEMVAAGQTMLLAPTVNILRHPSWGRAQETYGEDPFLLGRLGSDFVVGVQEYVGACVKHFAASSSEQGGGTGESRMDEQTQREIYSRHFDIVG